MHHVGCASARNFRSCFAEIEWILEHVRKLGITERKQPIA
jgi:hypothetical protein